MKSLEGTDFQVMVFDELVFSCGKVGGVVGLREEVLIVVRIGKVVQSIAVGIIGGYFVFGNIQIGFDVKRHCISNDVEDGSRSKGVLTEINPR